MTHVRGAVARTAASDGDSLAIRSSGESLTYRELDDLADRVAGFLSAHDIGEGDRVVVRMARGVDLLPVLLGIMGAGAAFVPVDASSLVDRADRIVRNCAAALIVTDEERRHDQVRSGPPVVTLADMTAYGVTTPAVPEAERAAYVIYTSGTTGEPKGVVVGSTAMHRYLEWARAEYRMDAGTGAPLFTSIGFDATLTTLFGPLLVGKSILIIGEDDPVLHLAEALRGALDFSFVKATPHHVRLLAELLEGECPDAAMRCLVVGGDELDTVTLKRWTAICPVRVVNEYGPTETVVGCSAFAVLPGEIDQLGATVPIGRGIAGAQLHVLNENGEPTGPSTVGELFITGPSANNYYLSQPGATAARFVPDPFGSAGARMYRTGDLASVRPDGVVEFHGRADRQIKVRGFRVELGEVEAAVRAAPGVVDAAAFVDRASGEVMTVVVYTGDAEPDAIREDLMRRVPTWIVPHRIVHAGVLPTTTNAKADLVAAALIPGDDTGSVAEAPADGLTATIIAEFGAVLPAAVITSVSDFFTSGGDSMSGIRLVARLRRRGHNVNLTDVTSCPTPGALAALIATREPAPTRSPETQVGLEVKLTPAQRDFLSLGLPNQGHWNQITVVAATDGFERERLTKAIAAIAARYDVLRYRFRDGRQVHVGGAPALDFHEVTVNDDAGLDEAIREANTGLDLVDGPLARAVLVQRRGGPDHLVLVAHHLIVDEASWHILLDDLIDEYRAEDPGRVPPLAGSFSQWRADLARFAERPEVQARRPYWDNVLATPVGRLPQELDGDDYGAEHYRRESLEGAATAALRASATAANVGVDEILLGAFVDALTAVLGIAPPLVDVESHGRVAIEHGHDSSRVIGWCTAVFPVVLTGRSIVELIRSARTVLSAQPWDGTEFGLLRTSEVAPSRSSQVLFNYLGERDLVLDHQLGWSLVDPPPGAQSPPAGQRPYALEFQSRIFTGEISWEFRAGADHTAATVQALSDHLRRSLSTVAEELTADQTIRFADSGLSAAELSAVMAQFPGPDGTAPE